jgi:antitoxin FitA
MPSCVSGRLPRTHQSLQEYLPARLIDEAGRPRLDEILHRAGGRAGGSVPLKTAERVGRDEHARR